MELSNTTVCRLQLENRSDISCSLNKNLLNNNLWFSEAGFKVTKMHRVWGLEPSKNMFWKQGF